MFSDRAWSIDLVANLGAQFLLLSLIVLLIVLALRRRGPVLVVLGSCLLHLPPLLLDRAAYLPKALSAPGESRPPSVVRCLHYNDSNRSEPDTIRALMDRSNADVMHILSPPVRLQTPVIEHDALRTVFPGRLLRPWRPRPAGPETEITPAFVVSRWPITQIPADPKEPMSDRLLVGIVERPGGRFGVLAMHPISPRTSARWEEGNAVVVAAIRSARALRAQGLPVVVLGDLNSTPSGYRSRLLCSAADLRRAKPLLVADGTHPDQVPTSLRTRATSTIRAHWPLRIAIDDAAVSPEIRVVGWEVLPEPSPEHSPIIVELDVPTSPMKPLP